MIMIMIWISMFLVCPFMEVDLVHWIKSMLNLWVTYNLSIFTAAEHLLKHSFDLKAFISTSPQSSAQTVKYGATLDISQLQSAHLGWLHASPAVWGRLHHGRCRADICPGDLHWPRLNNSVTGAEAADHSNPLRLPENLNGNKRFSL